MAEKIEKDEAFYKVLSAAMELDVKKGHQKWTLSDLARKSGITRSLIYYYFGRSKANIIEEAVKMIGGDVTGMNPERTQMWERGELDKAMMEARSLFEKAPFLGPFYMEHRNKDTDLGGAIRKVEKGFYERLQNFFPEGNEAQIKALFVAYWGMAFAPECDEDTIKIITGMMKSSFGKA